MPEPNFDLTGIELRMMVAGDDVVVPPVAVEHYVAAFAQSAPAFLRLAPSDYGLPRLDISRPFHLGSVRSGQTYWRLERSSKRSGRRPNVLFH